MASTEWFQDQRQGDHKVLFIFENELHVKRILVSELWSFDKHLVVLQWNEDVPLRDLKFDHATFWVQV